MSPGSGSPSPPDYVQLRQQTVRADGTGAFSTSVTLTQVGVATITATGAPSGLSASASVRVLAAGAAMPVTGDSTFLSLALIGSALIATGVIIAVLARSRRRRPADPTIDA
jgi:hypothetical protein